MVRSMCHYMVCIFVLKHSSNVTLGIQITPLKKIHDIISASISFSWCGKHHDQGNL